MPIPKKWKKSLHKFQLSELHVHFFRGGRLTAQNKKQVFVEQW